MNLLMGVNGKTVNAEVLVIKGEENPILGFKTTKSLGILKVGEVSAIKDQMLERYQDVFKGLGKLKDFQLKLNIDPLVAPVAQPTRRVPFHLREKASEKLRELLKEDVLEHVEGSTEWVSPMVVAPKQNGDVRVCVDMRSANAAVIRERHPIPTVDEILEELKDATIFSRLDLRWGFHQVELAEESRFITTFSTHEGLFRYKRLNFGISSAPEVFQRIVQQVLSGLAGARSIAVDIIIFGNEENHEGRLQAVLQRLQSKGLTLNRDKCEFGVSKTTFMGHVLTPMGVAPRKLKEKAVIEAKRPENPAEIRSFLGLVTYMSKFVKDLATVSEPLRQLSRDNLELK